MAVERFPKAKYLRQLHAMYEDLGAWRSAYRIAQLDHPDDWLGAKFGDREAVLEQAQHEIHQLVETLQFLPRVR
jgi:hypothetical protein